MINVTVPIYITTGSATMSFHICVLVIPQNTMHIFISPYPYVAQQPTNAFAQAKLVDGQNFVAAENAIEFHMITCF